jgi:hypothetical protein
MKLTISLSCIDAPRRTASANSRGPRLPQRRFGSPLGPPPPARRSLGERAPTTVTPSSKSSRTAAATLSARRVFPTPPGPVIVMSGCPPIAADRAATSGSWPMKDAAPRNCCGSATDAVASRDGSDLARRSGRGRGALAERESQMQAMKARLGWCPTDYRVVGGPE